MCSSVVYEYMLFDAIWLHFLSKLLLFFGEGTYNNTGVATDSEEKVTCELWLSSCYLVIVT